MQISREELESVMSPSAVKYLDKEYAKVAMATQFIGEGSKDSSTNRYHELYDSYKRANTGCYCHEDIIFVSSNGKRNGAILPVIDGELIGEYKNIELAMMVGASFIMDTESHLHRTSWYNIGEISLAMYMVKHEYVRIGLSGVWVKYWDDTTITVLEGMNESNL